MFEKEAEDYVMREDVITENDRVPFDNGYGFQTESFEDEVKKSFKDGAEFGYNKANEWHDLRKNPDDLPKDCKGKLYLIDIYSDSRLKFEYAEYTPTVCLWNPEWKRFEILELTVGSRIVNIRDVIAWKEIVLPKESE